MSLLNVESIARVAAGHTDKEALPEEVARATGLAGQAYYKAVLDATEGWPDRYRYPMRQFALRVRAWRLAPVLRDGEIVATEVVAGEFPDRY